MKPILYLIIFSLLIISSCKKDSTFRWFEINNVHDLSVTSGNHDTINLEVKRLAGDKIEVSLLIDGLPDGVIASFTRSGDTPSFYSVLDIQVDIMAQPGDYPLVITGHSDKGVKSYNMVLHIDQGNYWKVGSEVFRPKGYASYNTGNYYSYVASDSAGHEIVFEFYNGFPAGSGNYSLINFPVTANQVAITAVSGGNSYISSGADGKSASVEVSGTTTTISSIDFLATSISSPPDSVIMSCYIKAGG
jgi:hypothetical protein